MTEHVRFDHDWQTLGRSLMTGVVGPAAAIAPILAMSGGPQTLDEVSPFLAGTPLGNPAFETIIADVMGQLSPSSGSGRHGFDDHIERVQAEALKRAEEVAAISHTGFQGEGNEPKLTRTSFVEDRLGVSASHGAVLVAWSMQSAPEMIDACIDAVKGGRPLPDPVPPVFTIRGEIVVQRKLIRATDLLRRTVKPDREASKMEPSPKFDNVPGRAMIREALIAFAATRPQQAIDALWVDPRSYFL